ncbi:transposase [Endozoicomonas sp. ISHI1]|uniref:transposase n=1 Tax=unclassified Endozoicomonas TaxID=2644528 RepID=UPI0035A17676
MKAFDKEMLRKRTVIESVNDHLRNISGTEYTRHRSLYNFAVNLIVGLIACHREPGKPHIDISVLTEGLAVAF